eukprot:TRINITY_DN3195_c0_g1_i7.p1 TRINITY_DN3195_c0_g1~~TRINITY_DN3195_c0_g1_i7.p1  ORF type:complete len:123 (-),score=16.31 TRINITY_DN3195_c0_g1_i7:120-488(-)
MCIRDSYRVGTTWPHDHICILDSDEARFGGQDRLIHGHHTPFPVIKEGWDHRYNYLQVYIPSRTCMALRPIFPSEIIKESDSEQIGRESVGKSFEMRKRDKSALQIVSPYDVTISYSIAEKE